MRDVEAITSLCKKLGGLTAAAAELSKDGEFISPQAIYAWRKHGRVAPEQRQRFREVFNRVMPKGRELGMDFLATPAAKATNGAGTNGRTSGRKKAKPKGKRAARSKARR